MKRITKVVMILLGIGALILGVVLIWQTTKGYNSLMSSVPEFFRQARWSIMGSACLFCAATLIAIMPLLSQKATVRFAWKRIGIYYAITIVAIIGIVFWSFMVSEKTLEKTQEHLNALAMLSLVSMIIPLVPYTRSIKDFDQKCAPVLLLLSPLVSGKEVDVLLMRYDFKMTSLLWVYGWPNTKANLEVLQGHVEKVSFLPAFTENEAKKAGKSKVIALGPATKKMEEAMQILQEKGVTDIERSRLSFEEAMQLLERYGGDHYAQKAKSLIMHCDYNIVNKAFYGTMTNLKNNPWLLERKEALEQ